MKTYRAEWVAGQAYSYRPVVVGIDPGLRCTGVAYLAPTHVALASVRTDSTDPITDRVRRIVDGVEDFLLDKPRPKLLVIEHMQVYQTTKGDPNDLINLALIEGAMLSRLRYSDVLLAKPAQWKGQTPKAIMRSRLTKLLDGEIPRMGHDVWDAFGLAVYGDTYASTF